jgi:hypothetical protein
MTHQYRLSCGPDELKVVPQNKRADVTSLVCLMSQRSQVRWMICKSGIWGSPLKNECHHNWHSQEISDMGHCHGHCHCNGHTTLLSMSNFFTHKALHRVWDTSLNRYPLTSSTNVSVQWGLQMWGILSMVGMVFWPFCQGVVGPRHRMTWKTLLYFPIRHAVMGSPNDCSKNSKMHYLYTFTGQDPRRQISTACQIASH